MTDIAAPAKLIVSVENNGITHQLDYHPHQHGHALFEQACNAFGIPPGGRGELALYLPDDTTEVPPDLPIQDGGVKPDTTLVLRPRRMSTGSRK